MLTQLSLFYQNVRGLNTKLFQVRTFVNVNDYDVITFTETFLHDGVSSSEIFNDNYAVYRNDRDTYAGGSLIAIKNTIISTRVTDFESGVIEDVWVKAKLKDSTLYICCVYIPPHKPHTTPLIREFMKKLYDNLSTIEDDSKILIFGDFNMPHLSWNKSQAGDLSPSGYLGYPLYEEFIEILDCFAIKNISEVKNRDQRQLDLVITNTNINSLKAFTSENQACNIDPYHPPIEVEYDVEVPSLLPPRSYPKFDFNKADYNTLNRLIAEFDWTPISILETNEATTFFYEAIMNMVSQHVPLKPDKGKFPIWYSNRLIFVVNAKTHHHNLWKLRRNQRNLDRFREFRSEQNRLERVCYAKFIRNVENNVHSRMKEFWRFTKSLKKTNTYPNSISWGDRSESEAKKIADMFADYFASNLQNVPPTTQNDNVPVQINMERLTRIEIEQSRIINILKDLDVNKGPGDDGISATFLKNTADSICIPLAYLYQNSLDSGIFPDQLKITKTHPIFKKGNASLVENYRPIAILDAIEKVFECLVHETVYDFINPLIRNNMHSKRVVLP